MSTTRNHHDDHHKMTMGKIGQILESGLVGWADVVRSRVSSTSLHLSPSLHLSAPGLLPISPFSTLSSAVSISFAAHFSLLMTASQTQPVNGLTNAIGGWITGRSNVPICKAQVAENLIIFLWKPVLHQRQKDSPGLFTFVFALA